jgi:hypothetical protein
MVIRAYVPADTRVMSDPSPDELREELATLEAAEARVSAQRRRLHEQIDFGYATESSRTLEREVSDERRRLHERIDAVRKLLGLEAGPAASVEPADGDLLPLDPR